MLHVGDRGEEDGQLHLVFPGLVHGVHGHEGCGAHAVADVMDFLLPRLLYDIVQHGGEVVLGHLVPGEPPEGCVHVRVEVEVAPAVGVAPVVAEPHVVALLGQSEGGGSVVCTL